ncbi:peptide synthase [compost metagenome]
MVREQMGGIPEPQINFNFRGASSVDSKQENSMIAKKAPCPETGSFYSDLVRNNLLLFDCAIEDKRLNFVWNYSTEVHTSATIGRLTEMFIQELQHIVNAIGECVQ